MTAEAEQDQWAGSRDQQRLHRGRISRDQLRPSCYQSSRVHQREPKPKGRVAAIPEPANSSEGGM